MPFFMIYNKTILVSLNDYLVPRIFITKHANIFDLAISLFAQKYKEICNKIYLYKSYRIYLDDCYNSIV